MDKHQLDQLLKKYWSGDSSIEEEKMLNKYFTGAQVDEKHLVFKPLFAFFQHEKNIALKEPIQLKTKEQRIRWIYPAVRAAAVIIALVIIWVLIKPDPANVSQEVVLHDSYDDPEMAYHEVERALYYLSGHMNKGVMTAANGMEKMKTLDEILKY